MIMVAKPVATMVMVHVKTVMFLVKRKIRHWTRLLFRMMKKANLTTVHRVS